MNKCKYSRKTSSVSFIGYSKPDGVTTCKNPAIAVAKLNKKKCEDSNDMTATIWFMCVFQVIYKSYKVEHGTHEAICTFQLLLLNALFSK